MPKFTNKYITSSIRELPFELLGGGEKKFKINILSPIFVKINILRRRQRKINILLDLKQKNNFSIVISVKNVYRTR